MNDAEFALLLERYLDGSLCAAERTALREAVTSDPERRRQFEEQARQHVRLHAQTSRIDLSESQRIAVMVMDIANRDESSRHRDRYREQTLRQRLKAIVRGLREPPDSGAHRYARFALLRIFAPSGASVIALALLVLALLTVTFRSEPRREIPDDQLITVNVAGHGGATNRARPTPPPAGSGTTSLPAAVTGLAPTNAAAVTNR